MIKNVLIGVGIFILTLFVVIYGIHTFYTQPEYSDFCGKDIYSATSEQDCIARGGLWNQSTAYPYSKPTEPVMLCSEKIGCYEGFDKAEEQFRMVVFIITIIAGVLLVISGFLFFKLDNVGAGLMAGGIASFIYGAGGYWRYTENWIKFAMSLAGLILLIWFAYYIDKKVRKKS